MKDEDIDLTDAFGGETFEDISDKKAESKIKSEQQTERQQLLQRKLKRISRLINAGDFSDARDRIEKIEEEEEDRTGDCEIPLIYHYKMLIDYRVRSDAELIAYLSENGENISDNKNYRLAKDYADDADDEEELAALLAIENNSFVGSTKAQNNLKVKELLAEIAKLRDWDRGDNIFYSYKNKYSKIYNLALQVLEIDETNAEGQYYIGVCYYIGIGVNRNRDEAAKWFKKSAVQGYAPAQYEFGGCYFLGYGVVENKKEAFNWYKRSAEQGYALAQVELARYYEESFGVVTVNLQETEKWYLKAARQGNISGQYGLAGYYKRLAKEQETEKEARVYIKEAIKWYTKVAEEPSMKEPSIMSFRFLAIDTLVDLYEKGCLGLEKDMAEATKWYKFAAVIGYDFAQRWCEEHGVSWDNSTQKY